MSDSLSIFNAVSLLQLYITFHFGQYTDVSDAGSMKIELFMICTVYIYRLLWIIELNKITWYEMRSASSYVCEEYVNSTI